MEARGERRRKEGRKEGRGFRQNAIFIPRSIGLSRPTSDRVRSFNEETTDERLRDDDVVGLERAREKLVRISIWEK